ncbi:heme ABC transporter ATP-binding protein [Pigmentiphaga litoralis]|uniref:Iron complex transport system ATP-binding protein n=1 Tax=Pigmentiphaga litoralis TaxID=516702 RepID=A0A7Y9IUN3_9BURK|nr:heme ABC transporter ATP-binding protein [Pigmentiphaga litoralis]NYE22958.1 iron complex transport system ATP-binding protein [Pigmentiphaga litoralis]NYE83427.1 iron complex transport system ATP-binding protein [Pigmentiphaga litoralis]
MTSVQAPVLRVDALTVHRRQRGGADHAVLRDVSLTVAPGELVMLIGPNGAGKSTLLAAVSGDLAPASGRIDFDGKPLASWHRKTLAQRRAVLPQRAGLSLPFTVQEVIKLGCLARTGSHATLTRIVNEAAAAAGVDHLAHRSMTQLSGGEQARVHLARVLAQIWPEGGRAAQTGTEPTRNLLLLDEPCASLDPHHQHAVCTVVRDFAHRTGTGVVITMHDMNLAGQYGDRVVALLDGAVVADGTPRDVLTRTFVQQCFAVDAARIDADGGLLVATRPWAG